MSVFRSKSEILLLEPCDGKLSRTVLRGESARKGADLPALAEYGCEDFILVGCYRFGKWAEEECLSNNK